MYSLESHPMLQFRHECTPSVNSAISVPYLDACEHSLLPHVGTKNGREAHPVGIQQQSADMSQIWWQLLAMRMRAYTHKSQACICPHAPHWHMLTFPAKALLAEFAATVWHAMIACRSCDTSFLVAKAPILHLYETPEVCKCDPGADCALLLNVAEG